MGWNWDDLSLWIVVGFAGNALFFSRFLVQWIASERRGRSYVPVAFWWLSIAGSLVLLAYAIHRRDPVFTLAFLPNCVVYVRNLMLIRKERRAADLETVGSRAVATGESRTELVPPLPPVAPAASTDASRAANRA